MHQDNNTIFLNWGTDLNRIVKRGNSNDWEMFSIFSHQGNPIKTALGFHLTLVRMAKINEMNGISCSIHCWWDGIAIYTVTKDISMVVHQKVGNQSTSNTSIPLLGTYLKDTSPYHSDTMIWDFPLYAVNTID